jgi:hypothetical protein
MPPRVLFLGRNDWANVSHRVARAMNVAAGQTIARVLVLEQHPFGYPEDMVLGRPSSDGWRQWGRSADWLISTGDGEYSAFMALAQGVDRGKGQSPQRRATAHVGSAYREAAAEFNTSDALIGWDLRFIGGDLFRFALNDWRARPYFAPPDSFALEPVELGERIRIAHSPSNRLKKGTAQILAVLEQLAAKFPHVDVDLIEGLPFNLADQRRRLAHVCIDQMNEHVGGFGASAVEALAGGCVVLADVRHVHAAVHSFYRPPPIIDVRTPNELGGALQALVENREFLAAARTDAFRWALEVASPLAVGRYWLSQLESVPERPT